MHEQAFIISERETFKANYDKNDDGRLDRDEILSWIIPNSSWVLVLARAYFKFIPPNFAILTISYRQIAAEETKHLMAAADDNHDLLLSYDEVLDNHDVFVGSEVTDFGEHLHNIHTIMDEL